MVLVSAVLRSIRTRSDQFGRNAPRDRIVGEQVQGDPTSSPTALVKHLGFFVSPARPANRKIYTTATIQIATGHLTNRPRNFDTANAADATAAERTSMRVERQHQRADHHCQIVAISSPQPQ